MKRISKPTKNIGKEILRFHLKKCKTGIFHGLFVPEKLA